ncbi:hypothetical protein GLAREA_03485 [Glarea lozoyensis ATCC 20868]|uniref:Ubiquitin 3 binding protein But2 C-terminal domain-containing protein n=2 Tax=Glarea lozoyensis TaxID=101852 RepID=S3DVU6_GLAL2|nr:uncharacterized protein GLAREA_03485 [Glarea lozoyensis ATCC 20868]EHK98204.1 hypothetical protein M7I_5969 [Glarea lozoyensis 74030]EPE30518.1 hypothetical protein GLAREA_03485 [Glarea lozoyensis ATCC 20868]
MQFSTVFSLTAFVASALALPTGTNPSPYGTIIFKGAANAQYTLSVPLDGSETFTHNALSISSLTSTDINVPAQCTLKTVDYTPALVEGPARTWVVGPPQTVISITCTNGSTPPPNSITIEFQGADPSLGAKYFVTVPLNGQVVPTNNVLSISTLVSSYPIDSKCTFTFVDGHAALAKIATDKWAVGPPQTIINVKCVA